MSNRQIHNYDSVVLRDCTIEQEGHDPDKLGKSSRKHVWAVCRYCGEPSRLTKGNFNKIGSACHKECRIEQLNQQKSPFSDPEVRKKAQQTIKKKYGVEHASSSEEVANKISKTKRSKKHQDKVKESNLEKFGVENVFQSDEVKQRIKQSNLKKYGVNHPLQNEEIKDKLKDTNQQNYGCDNPVQNKDVLDKIKDSNIKKYGAENPMQNADIQDKARNSSLDKYGVTNPAQSQEVRGKIESTNLEKYGSKSPFGNDIVRDKIIATFIERYGVENVFSSPKIRSRVEQHFLNKYGSRGPMSDPEVKEKAAASFLEKYGYTNPAHSPEVKEKIIESYNETVKLNPNNKYDVVNTLRYNENFWEDLTHMSLTDICEKYDLHYPSLSTSLLLEEFRERYFQTYSFPKQQTQNKIRKQLEEYGLEIEFNNRQVIKPLELDIYIPSKNFAIEFNGSYWHSEAVLDPKESRNKHIQKTKLCRERGVRLFHIFEHQWHDRHPQILNFIKTIVGANDRNVPARKCKLTHHNVKQFINDNHIQGYGARTLKFFNLEYEGEVVASMTAAKHHRQNSSYNAIVLNRLCFADGVNVQGGSSKLFKYFRKWAESEGYDHILSWSDNCWTDGDIYTVLGFELDEEFEPDYFYYDVSNRCYRSKQSQKKSSVGCPAHLTEREWCLERGLFRLWDCGKRRWIYKLV